MVVTHGTATRKKKSPVTQKAFFLKKKKTIIKEMSKKKSIESLYYEFLIQEDFIFVKLVKPVG